MTDINIIKLAALTVILQVMCVIVGYGFWFIKQKFTKKNLLKNKIEITNGMIIDKKIDIETNWILLRMAEKVRDKLIAKAKDNLKEIEAEREKDEVDMDKVQKLIAENVDLGWTGEKIKGDKDKYERKILAADVRAERYYSEIEKAVGEREYLKLRLDGIEQIDDKKENKENKVKDEKNDNSKTN